MSNYTDRVNLKGSIYYLSADFVNSANMSTIASSYTFDKPVEIWDDFMQIKLDHPYQYGEQVTALRASAINLQTSAQDHTFTTNVYDAGYNVITTAHVNAHVLSSFDFFWRNNSHFVESINGDLSQTAHVTETIENQQWVVPVKFKIASYFKGRQFLDLYNPPDGDDDNIWGFNRQGQATAHHLTPTAGLQDWQIYDYTIWGTTVPAVLFKEAGIYNIPVYKEDDPSYKLNVQIFDTLGNVGHVADVSTNSFVQFMNGLQNISNCEITSGSIKATQYTSADRIISAHSIAYMQGVTPYTVFSANVDDTRKSVGSVRYSDVNAFRYAFYNAQGNYQALDVTNDAIYDEYTYYCVMPTASYSTTSLATAAIQNVIDSCTYTAANALDVQYSFGNGTIPGTALVFNFRDEILTPEHCIARYPLSDEVKWSIIPQGEYIGPEGEYCRVTAVLTDQRNILTDIYTVITKPEILTADIRQIATTSYSYAFDSLYVVNSAFNYFNSSSNKTIYKDAVANMILYSSPEVAPVEQCRATYAGYDVLCCNYYNVCHSAFKHDKLPASTDRMIRNESLIPVALASTTYTTASFAEPPTRSIYFTITMSK